MKRLRGVKALVHDAVDHTVDLVELGHESTSRTVMRILNQATPLAVPARQVDSLRRGITSGILGTIKAVNHLVAAISDAGLDAVQPHPDPHETLLPMRSDLVGSPLWMADAATGAVNGVVGDHLEQRANGLNLGMALRCEEHWIDAEGQGAPAQASPRIVVLVHGLATTEWSWCLDAEKYLGDPAANFGTMLQKDLGYTPIFVRYNTGRHISENGRLLAKRLEQLVQHWPVPVEKLVLLGHSMGGLVARSACHIAYLEGQNWVQRTQQIVTLSSPLQGAPLEKFGNMASAVLASVDLPATAIIARLINGRSAGIKDLRHGSVRDDDWQGRDPDAITDPRPQDVALPPHIAWCFIAASVAASAEHPVSQILGDLLVRVGSASGPVDAPSLVTVRHIGGITHAAIQVQPAAYAIIHEFLK